MVSRRIITRESLSRSTFLATKPGSLGAVPCLNSADLQHARSLDDRRFPLPFRELGSFGAVGVDASKFLPVLIKNRNLPMLVFASSVFSQLGVFSLFQ